METLGAFNRNPEQTIGKLVPVNNRRHRPVVTEVKICYRRLGNLRAAPDPHNTKAGSLTHALGNHIHITPLKDLQW